MEECNEVRDVVDVDDDGGNDDGNDEGKFHVTFDLDFHVDKFRFDSSKERLRSLFDQVLVAFMREKSVSKLVRPTPVLCGDGRMVDLFKLFWVVRKIGGYDAVSRNNLWGFVSEECGLGFRMIPSIKLVYMKYLNELDQWLGQVFSKRLFEDGHSGLVQNLDLLSQDLKTRFRGLSNEKKRKKDSKFRKDTKDRAFKTRDISETELHISPNGNDDFSASGKSIVEKAVKETNKFSKGLTHDESGNSCNEDSGNITAPAEKVTEKIIKEVLNCGENIGSATDHGSERFSLHENNDVSISTKKVVKEVLSKMHDLSEMSTGDAEIFCAQRDISNAVPVKSSIGNVLESRKRKRESQSFSKMLNWLIHVAKHSDDPSVGLIPECSTWSSHVNEEFWAQAMLVRERLLIKRHAKTNTSENLVKGMKQDQHKKPKMHPSMYEDDGVLDHQSTEKLRCSKRIPSPTKSYLCPCCNSRGPPQSKDITHQKDPQSKDTTLQKDPQRKDSTHQKDPQSKDITHLEETNARNIPIEQVKVVLIDTDELPKYLNDHKSQVSLGPLFQAEIPELTGKQSESDPKWLGKRLWAPENGDKNSVIKLDDIGKGRQHSCNCPFRDSVECVRFHIAEKRLKLKLELGYFLFYQWRFNHMGEEVSLFWTEEEVKRFKCMMRSHAALSNKFWKNAPKFLPFKTREKIVSYYFNVSLIERRSYQNRVNPTDIDSDDDEKECGTIGAGFGYKALYIPGPSLITCTLNKESTELV